jgi:hypothetical protein
MGTKPFGMQTKDVRVCLVFGKKVESEKITQIN